MVAQREGHSTGDFKIELHLAGAVGKLHEAHSHRRLLSPTRPNHHEYNKKRTSVHIHLLARRSNGLPHACFRSTIEWHRAILYTMLYRLASK